MDNEIKVSVCVVTYNQEKYIAECLQSLVDQETDFKFEIIVGEDCSSDSTRAIVSEFYRKYSDIIVPLFHKDNVGAVSNAIATYKNAKGKYICHMDGDDYALPGKLQIQYDLMEKQPNCVICAHDVQLVDENDFIIKENYIKNSKSILTLDDLYKKPSSFAHSSKMFRNIFDDNFWNKLPLDTLDVELHIMQAEFGDVAFIKDVLGAYRFAAGITKSSGKLNPVIVSGVNRLYRRAEEQGLQYQKIHAFEMMSFAYQSAIYGDKLGFVKYIRNSIEIRILSPVQIAMYLMSFAPSLFVGLAKMRSKLKGY